MEWVDVDTLRRKYVHTRGLFRSLVFYRNIRPHATHADADLFLKPGCWNKVLEARHSRNATTFDILLKEIGCAE